jgi:hypothetical protein
MILTEQNRLFREKPAQSHFVHHRSKLDCSRSTCWTPRLLTPLYSRAMAQAVSRRPPTAEAPVRSRVSPSGICGGQSGTETVFSPSTSVLPCQFHSTCAPLHGKTEKKTNLRHRVAQKTFKLQCVRSVCYNKTMRQSYKGIVQENNRTEYRRTIIHGSRTSQ